MARKRKTRKASISKPSPATPLPPPRRWWQRWTPTTVVGWVWSAFLAVITIAGGWTVVKPVVHVEPYAELDSSSMFSERFKVSNDGYFSVYDVDATCTVLAAQSGTIIMNDIFQGVQKYRKELEAGGGSTTIDCPFSNLVTLEGRQWAGADIGFSVMYRPSWHFKRAEKYVTFSARRDSEGKVKWLY